MEGKGVEQMTPAGKERTGRPFPERPRARGEIDTPTGA